MSLRIRLARVGAKKQASYRIVVADSRAPRDGKAIAILGHYNPLTNPYTLKVDADKAVSWLKNGAQPSDTARGLLAKAGVLASYEEAKKAATKATKPKAAAEKAARAPRAPRTEPPRLVRPAGAKPAAAPSEPAAEEAAAPAAKPRAKAATTAKAPSKTATATSKSASKASGSRTKK